MIFRSSFLSCFIPVCLMTGPLVAADNYFYAGGRKHYLIPSGDWVGVSQAGPAEAAALKTELASEGVLRQGSVPVTHDQKRITVLPVTAGGSGQVNSDLVAEGKRPVRVFQNGTADPIVETEEFIVRFEPEITPAEAENLVRTRGGELLRPMGDFAPNAWLARVTNGQPSMDVANRLHETPGVKYAHPDLIWPMVPRYAPNDPWYGQQWHLSNDGSNEGKPGADIGAERAWEFTRGDSNVIIAIVDDGVETGHEDFASAGKMTGGWDFVGNDNNPLPGAGQNHGTACAGLAAADGNNSLGVSGVAPNCRIMPIRLLGPNQTFSADAAAMAHAKNNGAAIISNSWGPADGTGSSDPCPDIVSDALNDAATNGRGGKGCIITWAAGNGNESSDLDGFASHPAVICVSATLRNDTRSPYSDYGVGVDISAPGGSGNGDMVTVDRTGAAGYVSGNYTPSFNGTSAATPVVSGSVALLLSREPNLTRQQVYQRLIDSADLIDTANATYDANGHNNSYGYGRVNVWQMLGWNDNTSPTVSFGNITNNQVFTAMAAAEGTASDAGSGIYRVRGAVRNRATNKWWKESVGAWVDVEAEARQEALSGFWGFLLPAGEGLFELRVQAEDKAGNFSNFASVNYSVDNSSPGLTFAQPAAGVTGTSPAAVSGTASDTGTGIKEIRVALRDGSGNRWWRWTAGTWGTSTFVWADNAAIASGTTSWSRSLPSLTEGFYEVYAQALDNSNAASEWQSRGFTYDNGNPIITFNTPEQTPVFDFTVLGGTISEPGTVTWRLTEFNVGGTDRYWTGTTWTTNAGDGALWRPANVTGNHWRPGEPVPGRLSSRAGHYVAAARIVDRAGKTVETSVVLIRTATDTTPPDISFASPAAGTVVTTSTLPSFTGQAADSQSGISSVGGYLMRNAGGTFYYWNGRVWTLTATELTMGWNSASGTWSAPLTSGIQAWSLPQGRDLINGSWQLQLTARNGELPTGTRLATLSFTVDYYPTYLWTAGSNFDTDPNNNDNFWGNPDNWSPYGIPGSGDIVIIESKTVQSTISRTVRALRMSGGMMHFTNGAGASGTLTTSGPSTWSGGSFAGAWENSAGALLTISGTEARDFRDGSVLNNFGTVSWEGPAPLSVEGNGYVDNPVINNLSGGRFRLAASGDAFARNSGRSGVPVFNNQAGAVLESAGAAPRFNTFYLNNSGLMEFTGGSILTMNTVVNFTDAAPVTGIGSLVNEGGSFTVKGDLTASGPQVIFRGGDIIGHSDGTAACKMAGGGRIRLYGGRYFNTLGVPAGHRIEIEDAPDGVLGREFRDGFILNNAGTVNWRGGSPITSEGNGFAPNPVFNNKNGGVFAAAGGGVIFSRNSGRSGAPVFNNEAGAVFRKVSVVPAVPVLTVDTAVFNNQGALVVDEGILAFDTTVNHQSTTPLAGPGTYEFRGGRLGITGPFSMGSTSAFMLGGQVVSEANSASLMASGTARIHLRGGSYFQKFSIPSGCRVEIDDPAGGAVSRLFRDGMILDNSGTVTWAGGSAILAQGDGFDPNPVFNNKSGGSFLAASDGTLFARSSGRHGIPVLNNEAGATFRKSGGSGTLLLDTFAINNAGAMVCDSGLMAFNTITNHSSTVPLAGPGSYEFRSGRLGITGAFSSATQCYLIGGDIVSEGNSASLNASGASRMHLQGGLYYNRFSVPAGQRIELDDPSGGAVSRQFRDGFVLDNNGTVTWAGGSSIMAQGDGFTDNPVINNQTGGLFLAGGTGTLFSRASGRAGVPVFNNLPGAEFRKVTAPGDLLFDTFHFVNNGALSCRNGRLLFNTRYEHQSVTPLTGPGTYQLSGGNLVIRGRLGLDATRLVIAGGDLNMHADGTALLAAVNGGLFIAQGGRYFGQWTLAPDSRMNFETGSGGVVDKFFADGSVFINQGHVVWNGGGTIQAEGNGFAGNPIFRNLSGARFEFASGGAPFSRASGREGVPLFVNEPGGIVITTAPAEVAWHTFNLDQRGTVNAGSGGISYATEMLLPAGGLFNGTAPHRFIAGVLRVNGSVTAAGGPFQIAGGTVVGTATGSFNTSGTGAWHWLGGVLSGAFTNNGPLLIGDPSSGAAVKFLTDGTVFTNKGDIEWTGAGPIQAEGNGFAPNPVIHNMSGASFTDRATGVFNRASYRDGIPLLNNHGTLSIGSGTGSLSMEGWNFTQQATGILNVEIAGQAVTEFDRFMVGYTATLGGALQVTKLGGYAPVADLTFAILTAGARTGNFASVSAAGFSIDYTAGGASLRAVSTSAMDEWAAAAGLTGADALPMADPDKDGVSNFMEYALGMDPKSGSSEGLPVPSVSPTLHLEIRFSRRQPSDLTYIIENPFLPPAERIIAQLLPGATVWTGTAAVTETGEGALRSVRVADPTIVGTVAQDFLRLRVVGPE